MQSCIMGLVQVLKTFLDICIESPSDERII